MSDSGNLSKRLVIRGKDLTKSGTGLSALLIFLTLLMLGIVFGLRFEPQPPSIIQEATFVGADIQPSSIQNLTGATSDPSTQSEMSQEDTLSEQMSQEDKEYAAALRQQQMELDKMVDGTFDNYINQSVKNSELQESHASELNQLIESQEQENMSEYAKNEVYDFLNNQIEEREEIIFQEEVLVDDLLAKMENGKLPESITNGHTQALVQEKSLEKSIEEYEQSLTSDADLSEEAKNKIRNALSQTTSKFNEKRENRRDRLIKAKDQLSNDNLNTSEQEKLKALIEKEDMEYSTALRQQQMELDKMVDEEVIDQYVINDSSHDYQLARYQSEMLAKDIDGLQNELEEENGILVKPDSRIEELLSKESDRPSVEEEIDDSSIFLINRLSEETSEEEKEKLIAKNNKEKSQRRNLNNKKQVLLDQLSSSDNFDNEPTITSATNLVDKIDNLEQGLDLANQKIDLVLNILSSNGPSEVSKMGITTQSSQDRRKSNDQDDEINFEDTQSNEPEKSEIINQPLFTFDQVNSENKERLDKQLEYERREFNAFTGVDTLSEALKKKSKWFLSRATYRPDPTYPIEAEERSIEGECLVSFQINPNGTTEDTNANCTNDIFVTPTERTLKKWEFIPNEYINPMLDVKYVMEK